MAPPAAVVSSSPAPRSRPSTASGRPYETKSSLPSPRSCAGAKLPPAFAISAPWPRTARIKTWDFGSPTSGPCNSSYVHNYSKAGIFDPVATACAGADCDVQARLTNLTPSAALNIQ